MAVYADVIVNIASLDRSFQYLVPPELEEEICVGCAVRVPFGKAQRRRQGYVVALEQEPKIEEELIKPIAEILQDKIPAEGRLIRMAAWLRQTCGSTMPSALAAVLPVKDRRKRKAPETKPEGLAEDLDAIPEEMPLSDAQRRVLNAVEKEWQGEDRPILLQGVTGSGKTRIYIDLAEKVLAEGRQVIVLIPEIALSWQTVRRFLKCFGDRVSVMNSRMSKGARYDQFERMRSGDAEIVIGPRSALFAPFPSPGLIVIDEEQEPAFRSEMMPRYDSREVALFRKKEEGAHVVLGSATPSVDSYYRAQTGRYALVQMSERYGDAQLPAVQIVDMRQEQKLGNLSLISKPLEEAIRARLQQGEQAMLFLNRRGFSAVHTCQSCGHVLKCRNCNISLTLHTDGHLVCHYCGYRTPLPKQCPSCGSPHIQGFRYGTEKVEQDVRMLFPRAGILRMDADTTRHKNDYTDILGKFARHEADILIGTQMIVKGHDFPDVTLVGILAADLSLFASDYRAQERTYQLLVQAAGRSGRGAAAGEAIIQTLHPEHPCILQAVRQDYESFYEDEITARDLAGYPPTAQLLAIHGTSEDEARLHRAMEALRNFLLRDEAEEDLIGPAPEVISRKKNAFLEVLYVRGEEPEHLIRLRMLAEKYIAINSGFKNIRFSYEMNP